MLGISVTVLWKGFLTNRIVRVNFVRGKNGATILGIIVFWVTFFVIGFLRRTIIVILRVTELRKRFNVTNLCVTILKIKILV